jgi:poly-gamma-glutamate capsule biosynthesis protein CapA/YwtB (metallophosphatase superfamily)
MSDVLLAGDLYVGTDFNPVVADSVRSLVGAARQSIVNLEAPVTDAPERIAKTGPHLAMPSQVLDHIADVGFTGVALANNHILDAGLTGLADTMRQAGERGLLTVGASVDRGGAHDAARLRVPLGDGTLTLLNYCEHEWSVRSDGSGASGWDVITAFAQIQAARRAGDRVLVVLHGGNEYYPLPRPRLREELRFLAENGADAIVMHHSHVAAAYEVWHGVPIFYGLGNFQFTLASPYSGWYEGLLLSLTFRRDGPVAFEVHPIRQTRTFDVVLATEQQRAATMRELEGYRIQVTSDDALLARWEEFTEQTAGLVVQSIAPTSRLWPRPLRRLVEIAAARRLRRDVEARKALLNDVRCESHREALETSLRAFGTSQEDSVP